MQVLNGIRALIIGLVLLHTAYAPVARAQERVADGASGIPASKLEVEIGRSMLVTAPWPVARVSISQPEIADVQVISPTEVLVIGVSLGATDLLMWADDDRVDRRAVTVTTDLSYLREEVTRLFPDASIAIDQKRDLIILTGQLRRARDAENLRALLEALEVAYVDMTSVAGVQQVQLKVRVAEVSRNAIKALSFNALYGSNNAFFGQQIGSARGGALNPFSIGPPGGAPVSNDIPFIFPDDVTVSPLVTMFAGFPDIGLEFFLQALAENQYLRILAEPTLTAVSGEQASFLAGGEFPIPVVQGSSAGGGTSITIEYREFGVRLAFTPIVLGDNSIRLHVAPEVSDITDVGAIEIEGFRVPALVTRRSETTVELHSGQTMAMAGLLQQSTRSAVANVPVLGALPVLGPLFRSTRYERAETELVVLVTASLAEPISAGSSLPIPGSAYVRPNDWELFVGGRIVGKSAPVLSPSDRAWLKTMNVDKLLGPGGWATYSDDDAPVFPEEELEEVPD